VIEESLYRVTVQFQKATNIIFCLMSKTKQRGLCCEKEDGENNKKIPEIFGINVPNLKLVTVGRNVPPLK